MKPPPQEEAPMDLEQLAAELEELRLQIVRHILGQQGKEAFMGDLERLREITRELEETQK